MRFLLIPLLLTGATSLTDGRGRPVDVSVAPQRIASCALASDETLLALLRRAGHLERLVALSPAADNPRISNVAPPPAGIPGRCGGELESLLRLRPDLAVLASYNRPETLARLENAGVKTFVLGDFSSLDDIQNHIEALGRLTHTEAAAAELGAELRAARAKAVAAAPRRHPAVVEFFADGTVSGAGTLFDDLVRAAGGTNVAAARGLRGWPRLGAEALAALRPDAVVAAGEEADRERTLTTIRGLPGWQDMPAVQAGAVIMVPERELGAASQFVAAGLDRLAGGLRALAAAAAAKGGGPPSAPASGAAAPTPDAGLALPAPPGRPGPPP